MMHKIHLHFALQNMAASPFTPSVPLNVYWHRVDRVSQLLFASPDNTSYHTFAWSLKKKASNTPTFIVSECHCFSIINIQSKPFIATFAWIAVKVWHLNGWSMSHDLYLRYCLNLKVISPDYGSFALCVVFDATLFLSGRTLLSTFTLISSSCTLASTLSGTYPADLKR